MTNSGISKLTAIAALICGLTISGREASTASDRSAGDRNLAPPPPAERFSPSNARTEDGRYIEAGQFFPAKRCASCHQDTHAGWSESLHRNAARDPFYRESADILLRSRGIELTRHCESCHTPVALFSGALTRDTKKATAPFTPLDDEGVTCSVCHSITEARPDGTGSFTIRRPALLARADGTPVYGDLTDEQVLADVPGHKRAVMRPLLRRPEFCSTCHKVDAPPELNGYKHIRGFSAFDEWQQSGASHESVTPFYRRPQRADCRSCHMPKIESTNDRASKSGLISSHRWLGANNAASIFFGQVEQTRLINGFLAENVLGLDIFALRSGAAGTVTAPLGADTSVSFTPDEEVTVEVVVSNRNAAHSFPPEVRDLYEAWVEFEALDENGRELFHSGFVDLTGMLDQTAHVYKSILLDDSSRQITRHQIWLMVAKAYDNAILPGRSDVVRFGFRIPGDMQQRMPDTIRLRARVNYRRFNQEYADYVLARQNRYFAMPIVQMAESELTLTAAPTQAGESPAAHLPASYKISRSFMRPGKSVVEAGVSPTAQQARRWNDYGIGLLERAQYGAAATAFRSASVLTPDNPDLLVNAAIAELRTERYGPEREQLRKARSLLERAIAISPDHSRSAFYLAIVMRSEGRGQQAAGILARIANAYPQDREVQRQLGQTLYALGRLAEAREAFESVVAIDPQDAAAYQFLGPIYAGEGRKADADRARSLFLQWRDDPQADAVAARFFASHPEWAEERVWSHAHRAGSSLRPVLTGTSASPVQQGR